MMMHADDKLHVVLDALTYLQQGIEDGDSRAEAWRNYDPDPDDPKSTLDGYLTTMQEAREVVEGWLSAGMTP